MRRHIICERDVGLFSLVQQVIANVPWAVTERRVPIVYFGAGTCYWTPNGYADADNVWEYYFDPLVAGHSASSIPESVRSCIAFRHPSPTEPGYFTDRGTFASSHFGDHPDLAGKTLPIPYLWADPDDTLRNSAEAIISRFIRPRDYVEAKADRFFQEQLAGPYTIGVHIRGTDAISSEEKRPHRQGSLMLSRYVPEIQRLLEGHPEARIFMATDEEASRRFMLEQFGSSLIRMYNTIRHTDGQAAGSGPTGAIMPAYISGDRDLAARQGEEAVIDYLLLSRCDYLIHNGSSLARTALLKSPSLPHTNTHRQIQSAPPVPPEIVTRVRSGKLRRSELPLYMEMPAVSFIVHSFNRLSNINQLISGLRATGNHEIVVCEDGSIDGSREAWERHLDRPNDFLIHSNDLHEIRILDRAIRFASSDIICLVQDDDRIPTETAWLSDALVQFEQHPRLAVIGGFMGFGALGPGITPFWGETAFRFVHHANIGPYFIRRTAYESLGGWDRSFSDAGEPGILFDSEFCLRAWLNDYEVGYSFVPFKGAPGEYSHDGGTVLFSGLQRLRNKFRNETLMYQRYADSVPLLDSRVSAANRRIGINEDAASPQPLGPTEYRARQTLTAPP